jgi:hypothetical protein
MVSCGELPVIADHDHLASGPLGMVEEAGESSGADHGCFIDYHDGVTVEPFVASVQLPQQGIQGWCRQLGLAFQFAGGRPRRRGANDLEAAAVEGVHGRAGGVGLAGAGVADHQGDPGALLGDLADHCRLVGVEALAGGQASADVLAGDDRGAFAGAAFGLLHQAPLQRQQLRGGVAALLQAAVHGDRHGPLRTQERIGEVLKLGQRPLRGGGDR